MCVCGKDRSYGVMVSTLDFESSDPGSNPGRTSFLAGQCLRAPMGWIVFDCRSVKMFVMPAEEEVSASLMV